MATYKAGDMVKAESPTTGLATASGCGVKVDHCDEEKQVLFGRLDNQPISAFRDKLQLGQEVAVAFSLVREVWSDNNKAN